MKTCPVSTPQRLRALLSGELSVDETASLRTHLGDPCEDCLVLFEQLDDGELALLFNAQDAALTSDEADAMFEAAVPATAAATQPDGPGVWERLVSWMSPPRLLATGAIGAAAVLALAVGLGEGGSSTWTGVKGDNSTVELTLIGAGAAGSVRAVQTDDSLRPGEKLLFRVLLREPAHVQLIDADLRVLWNSPGILLAGDHEIASGGQALAMVPDPGPTQIHVVVVAFPSSPPTLRSLEALRGSCRPKNTTAACSVSERRVDVRAPSR